MIKITTQEQLLDAAQKIADQIEQCVRSGNYKKVEHETDKFEFESIKETLRRCKGKLDEAVDMDLTNVYKSTRLFNYLVNEVIYTLRVRSNKADGDIIKRVVFNMNVQAQG